VAREELPRNFVLKANHGSGACATSSRWIPPNSGCVVAAKLSADIDFIRVDLYETDNGVIFGELTNYPMGGEKLTHLPDVATSWASATEQSR
jgi:hypothetical protein